MTEKQLIVAVEGSAAMGPFWQPILSDYLEKIIRSFSATDFTGQKLATATVDLSLVTFYGHGSYSACLVQRSGWTRDVDIFLQWLSAIPFAGGGFSDAAIAEGLSEALMMFPFPLNGNQGQQNIDGQRHCVLIAASNPYPLPTPVYRPPIQNLEQSENNDSQTVSRLSDAETLAQSFPQCSISLSVICPKQLPKLRAIYNAGKRNTRAADPAVDNVKNPHFLVLISENFLEARTALSRPGVANLPSNQSPVKMDVSSVTSVAGPTPSSVPSANGSMMNRSPISVGTVPTATVKVEPTTVTSIPPGPSFPHMPSVRPTSQAAPSLQTSSPPTTTQEMITAGDNVPELKPTVSGMPQSVRPVPPGAANVSILNNISQARVMNSAALSGGSSMGLPSINQTPVAMHMSNMISSGMASTVPASQTVFSSGQPAINSITGSGTVTGTSQIASNSGLGSFASAPNMSGNSNIGISQPMGNLQSGISMGQSVPGMSQGNLSGTQMVQNGIGMNQNMMNGLGPSGVSSGPSTMIPTPGMTQQAQTAIPSLGVNNNPSANMALSQQTASALQSAQSKYVKVWEGNLSGQRQGQPVFITRLEGYRSSSASETLAANWPATMQIVRLISQDHMNNKQYVGKADFLVFRAMNQHGFLGQLQEKKLCAVIQLPSQTLLLSVSDKACRLIGMLFPGDMVVFKPQVSSSQQQLQMQQQHQQQLNQLQQQQQQLPQLQQQQQQQQQQLPQLQQQQQQQQQLTQLQQHQQQLPQLQQQQQQLSQLQQQQQQQQQQLPQLQQQQQQQLSQHQQQQLSQLQQQQQQQQLLPQLQQQQLPQQQQMVGTGMAQAYAQAQTRSQQGPTSMPGGNFMT
ncbi:Mediator of RNA polymerase II transcription subunit 25 [Euphorbia peplus]|nr:Mediator of RNA polymerase II transcription subunit 25 [Euphorbia peplus]